MMKKPLIALAFLVLSMLACSLQDLNNLKAGVNGTYALSPSPSPSSPQDVTAETRPERKDDLRSQNQSGEPYIVCTGNPTGNLRVRVAPSTSAAEVSLLAEGTEITLLDKQKQEDGSTWAKILAPAGWVNERFLCKQG